MKYPIDPDKIFRYPVTDKMQEEQLYMKSDIKDMGRKKEICEIKMQAINIFSKRNFH